MADEHAQYVTHVPTWKDRLAYWLFPSHDHDWQEAPVASKSIVVSTTVVHMDWKDRLRVLLGGLVVVRTRSAMDQEAHALQTEAKSYVHAPWKVVHP